MPNKIKIVGLLFATLTLSTAAMAQQGGGGGGGGGGGNGGGGQGGQGGDHNSVIAIRLQDHERLRVPGAGRARTAGTNCTAVACNERPGREPPPALASEGCGGDLRVAQDRRGRAVRQVCGFGS
ncbi:hypothetical protein ASE61_10360 [Bosea sp. Root670]|nr:hypothetical protein ASE61_10360 [Bosea sp. Root670]